jgi:signal transduction histidine kinase
VSDPGQPSRILVVDDDEGLLVLMAAALRAEGYAVVTAGSGAEMLRVMAGQKPDLLLLDLKLKDVEGRTLLQQLEQQGRRIPFVVVTGQGDEKVAVEMMRRGAVDYLRKDTGLLDLLAGVVSRALTTVARERALALADVERLRLEAEVLEISENEQRRIGQDLHDGLGQQLTAIELMCQSVVSDLEAAGSDLTGRVSRIGAYLRDSIAQTRMLAHSLAPYRLEITGLEAALKELATQTAQAGKIACRVVCPQPVELPSSEATLHLYRLAQEAVNNAIRHSGGDRIVVTLARVGGDLELVIADNGRGLPPERLAGIGLQVMRHRASVIGAELTVESAPGQGTTIRCRLPPAA